MARNKYTMFAKIARKEDLEVIARVFEETAENERVHAQEEFEMIKGAVQTPATLEIKAFATTSDNLRLAAEGEKYEWTTMYPDFAADAKEEKQFEALRLFENLAKVEAQHEERYIIIAEKLDSKTLFSSNVDLKWKCLNCGNIFVGKVPPKKCPVCLKPWTWYLPLGVWK